MFKNFFNLFLAFSVGLVSGSSYFVFTDWYQKNEILKQAVVNRLSEPAVAGVSDVNFSVSSSQTVTSTTVTQSSNSSTVTTSSADDSEYGTVTGKLAYPETEKFEMVVCGYNLDNDKIVCSEGIRNLTYSFKLPAGNYFIYARTNESNSFKGKAYYNVLECRTGPGCPAKPKPATVVVKSGKIIEAINPIDWYEGI
jgi:hypothetical protein